LRSLLSSRLNVFEHFSAVQHGMTLFSASGTQERLCPGIFLVKKTLTYIKLVALSGKSGKSYLTL
jgi:hypothetical protein